MGEQGVDSDCGGTAAGASAAAKGRARLPTCRHCPGRAQTCPHDHAGHILEMGDLARTLSCTHGLAALAARATCKASHRDIGWRRTVLSSLCRRVPGCTVPSAISSPAQETTHALPHPRPPRPRTTGASKRACWRGWSPAPTRRSRAWAGGRRRCRTRALTKGSAWGSPRNGRGTRARVTHSSRAKCRPVRRGSRGVAGARPVPGDSAAHRPLSRDPNGLARESVAGSDNKGTNKRRLPRATGRGVRARVGQQASQTRQTRQALAAAPGLPRRSKGLRAHGQRRGASVGRVSQ